MRLYHCYLHRYKYFCAWDFQYSRIYLHTVEGGTAMGIVCQPAVTVWMQIDISLG